MSSAFFSAIAVLHQVLPGFGFVYEMTVCIGFPEDLCLCEHQCLTWMVLRFFYRVQTRAPEKCH